MDVKSIVKVVGGVGSDSDTIEVPYKLIVKSGNGIPEGAYDAFIVD